MIKCQGLNGFNIDLFESEEVVFNKNILPFVFNKSILLLIIEPAILNKLEK